MPSALILTRAAGLGPGGIAAMAFGAILGDFLKGWGFGMPGAKITTRLRQMYFASLMQQEIGDVFPLS